MSQARVLASLVCLATGCGGSPAGLDGGTDTSTARPDGGAGLLDAPGADGTLPADVDADTARDASPPPDPDAGPRCPDRPRMGLFVWTDELVSRRDAILDLADAHEVTELYLHANLFYSGDVEEDVLALWIATANARCIDVELLFGNARWILPAGHAEATARARWTVGFAGTHPEARPSGLHFDLEPQQLDEWDVEADRPALIADLADVLEAATAIGEAGSVPVSNDIGFFLDGYDVTRGGRTRPGSEWITDAVSRIVIMDYRDTAESDGHGGMISLAQDEVAYATSIGTPIVLAVETQPIAEEYVTFREEGLTTMLAELALVRAHFGVDTTLAGFAIHDEDGLAALGP